jgi:hypothetical protein
MTEQDELSRLARAITEAEDELNSSNHRDNLQQLAVIDSETRPHLVERIDAREKALDDARDAMRAYAQELASEGAVKVEIETQAAVFPTVDELHDRAAAIQTAHPFMPNDAALGLAVAGPFSPYQTAYPQPSYSNGLDGHKED